MNKSKTLEVLRGMKFMQRKEEAKRRALFEAEQRDELDSRMTPSATATGGGRAAVATGPKILYDGNFPRQAYTLSRRNFYVKEEKPLPEPTASPVEQEMDAQEIWLNDVEHGDGDEDALVDDPTAASSSSRKRNRAEDAEEPKRFHPQKAIRAPKLPKRLAEEMEQQENAKRRRREEEELDFV